MAVDKRYQVFISSTKKDLEEERRAVAERLLRNGFIPVGMEQFPASDRRAWDLITAYIDQVDYYVVIVAGKYGSTESGGLSFTEREYDYAVSTNKPVLAFLHDETQELLESKVERDPERMARLESFRAKIERDRVRRIWRNRDELASDVVDGLRTLAQSRPAAGWIRGDSVPDAIALKVTNILTPAEGLGINRISKDGVSGAAMGEALAKARKIRILSTSAVRILETYRDQGLVEALANGCEIRLLLPAPDGEFVRDVERVESEYADRSQGISGEIRDVTPRMREALGRASRLVGEGYGSTLGSVSIGHFTTQLRSTLVLCDAVWGWLTITLPPFRAPETASLELGPAGRRSLLGACIDHFDRLWTIVASEGVVVNLD